MCGIAGILAYGQDAPPVDKEELLRIRDSMTRRGPDGEGLWLAKDHRAGLAHRRLAIIDLTETGAQPMASASGRYRITFNGEIYNYRELRSQLAQGGRQFNSHSDTEVLLALYEDRGAGMVHLLRGMYAFGIHDLENRTLFLARDPFGIKPLYYADDGRTFRFASQVKALLKSGKVDSGASPAGHVGFYLWGHVPDPHTLFEGIKALGAGSSLLVGPGGPGKREVFFSIAREFAAAKDRETETSPDAKSRKLHAGLKDSVRHHMVADVPVGIFLSSGLDSTTITALASELADGDLRTVTLGFNEYRGTEDDETPLASLVARKYGTAHRTDWVSRNNFATHMEEMLEAMDQPSIDGVNTYFVSRAAAQGGMKVALSGIGGDELFGGYPSFREVPLVAGLLGASRYFPALGRAFRRVSAPLLKRLTSPKYAGLLEYGGSFEGAYLLRRGLYMPWELPEFLDGDFVRRGWNELQTLLRLGGTIEGLDGGFQKVSALELNWYMRNQLLRDADWAGMAHSLEIRVPLVDVELFRLVAAVAVGGAPSKLEMASAPANPLPDRVLERRKTGFSIPVRDWLRQAGTGSNVPRGIRGWALRILPPPRPLKRSLALVTDAFGSHGGIAKFNRDFLGAACSYPGSGEVVAIPRLMFAPVGELPRKLAYLTDAIDNKIKYALKLLQTLVSAGPFDVVVCGHINLLPMAWFARILSGGRLVLIIHGIDAWKPTASPVANLLVRRVDSIVSVSAVTRERFVAWSGVGTERIHLLPNSIDAARFSPRPKRDALVRKYSLEGKTVVMTMGRLVSAERYKGFDEILEVLPELIEHVPGLVYMIAGEGDDRVRLQSKAGRLGIRGRVVFTGFVPEEQKCDYYNLADAFVMPSRGEGFGIVFLEAMACGIPVVGSLADGSREALCEGALGELVNPSDPQGILRAILAALQRPRGVPDGLEYFSYANFERRVHQLMDRW